MIFSLAHTLFPAPPTPAPTAPAPLAAPQWREVARFFVNGIPRPGGSKTAKLIYRGDGQVVTKNGRPLITMRDDAKGNAEWKQTVAVFAAGAFKREPLTGELKVDFTFYLPRIKSHFSQAKRSLGQLRPDAPAFHSVKPDKTKLTRSTEDALTGLVWADDARIVGGEQWKKYVCAESGERPGVRVTVCELVTGGAS